MRLGQHYEVCLTYVQRHILKDRWPHALTLWNVFSQPWYTLELREISFDQHANSHSLELRETSYDPQANSH